MWFYSDHSLRAYLAVPSRGALTYCTPFNGGWPRHSFNHMATIQTCKCSISPAHLWEWVQALLSAITQVMSWHHTGMHVTPLSSKINSKNLDTYWQTNSQLWANQVDSPTVTYPDHAEDSENDNNAKQVSSYFNLIESLQVLIIFIASTAPSWWWGWEYSIVCLAAVPYQKMYCRWTQGEALLPWSRQWTPLQANFYTEVGIGTCYCECHFHHTSPLGNFFTK